MIKFDVILPVCGLSNLTRDMLVCIRDSTVKPETIFLIDNGNDDTQDVVNEFSDLNIHYIKNAKNIGVNRSWEQGMKLVSSEIVAVLNNDILFPSYTLEMCLDALDADNDFGLVHPAEKRQEEWGERPKFPVVMDDPNGWDGYAMFIRKSILDEIGSLPYWLVNWYGDFYLRERTVDLGYKNMRVSNAPVYHLRNATTKEIKDTKCLRDDALWKLYQANSRSQYLPIVLYGLYTLRYLDIQGSSMMAPYRSFYEFAFTKVESETIEIVELGTEKGISARMLMEILDSNDRDFRLMLIDPVRTNEAAALTIDRRIVFMEKDAESAIEGAPDRIDFLHIDVDPHEYEQTKTLIKLYLHRLSDTGVAVFHDASPIRFGVHQALLELPDKWVVEFCKERLPYPEAAPAIVYRRR